MKHLWLIHQSETRGYDTYSAAVVVAESEEEARHIHPNGEKDRWWGGRVTTWAHPDYVVAHRLGPCESAQFDLGGVVSASFHAG